MLIRTNMVYLRVFVISYLSVALQCLTLSNKYKHGKLLAYQLLCQMMVRQPDVSIPSELLAQFYQILQQGLCSQDQVMEQFLGKFKEGFYGYNLKTFVCFTFMYV